MGRARRIAGLPLALCLLSALACASERLEPVEPSPSPAERIVTLAPSLTEIVFALGLGERVVGVGSFADFPPEAREKPRLGGLVDPNLELVVALDPDLAILLPSEGDVGRRLAALGVDVLTVESDTLEHLFAAVTAIARRAGVDEEGRTLRARLESALAPRPVAPGKRVMLTLGRPRGRPAEVAVAGPGTFYDRLLERLGAVNVFADAGLPYPTVGLEEILRRDPELIVELYSEPLAPEEREALRADWQEIAGLSAPARGGVRQIDGSFTMIPGPRLVELYERLAAALGEATSRGLEGKDRAMTEDAAESAGASP